MPYIKLIYIRRSSVIRRHVIGLKTCLTTLHWKAIIRSYDQIFRGASQDRITTIFQFNTSNVLGSAHRIFSTFKCGPGEAKSRDKPIAAGVLQSSVLGPILYLLYTADIPSHNDTTLAIFADDIVVLSPHANHNVAASRLQITVTEIVNWATR